MLTLAALAGGVKGAYFMTGNKLLENLSSTEPMNRMMGSMYVRGVHDARQTFDFCTPDTVTPIQLRDLVKQALERSPQARHVSAQVLVIAVLSGTFPCPKE